MICRKVYLFLAIISLVLLIGCTRSPTIKTVDLQEYENFFKEGHTGFVVVTNVGYIEDNRATLYLETLKQVLEEENSSAIQYDVYLPDGEIKDINKAHHVNPYSDVTHTEKIHYVLNGEVVSDFDLTDYEGLELRNELENYIKLMVKH